MGFFYGLHTQKGRLTMPLRRGLILWLSLLGWLVACEGDTAPTQETNLTEPLVVAWQRPETLITPDNALRLEIGGTLTAHRGTVFEMQTTPNGQRLATLGGDERFVVWNIASGRSFFRASNTLVTRAFILPDDAGVLGLTTDARLLRWSLEGGDITQETDLSGGAVTAMALSPNGARLAIGGEDGSITLLDTQSFEQRGRIIASQGGFSVTGLYYDPSGDLLYSTLESGEVFAWNSANQARLQDVEAGARILGSVASPDGSLLAIARPERLNLYDTRSGARRNSFEIPPFGVIFQMEISQDNAWIAIGGNIDSVTLFDLASGELVVALREHRAQFGALAFSPDRQMIVTALDGGPAYLWDLSAFRGAELPAAQVEVDIPRARLNQVPDLRTSALVWSPEGQYILLADRSGPVYMLRVP